jgi:hypothetical protein
MDSSKRQTLYCLPQSQEKLPIGLAPNRYRAIFNGEHFAARGREMSYPRVIVRVGLAVVASLFVSAALAQSTFMNYYVRIAAAGKVDTIQSRANMAWDAKFVEYGGGFRYVFLPTSVSGDKKHGVMSFQVFIDESGAKPNAISTPLFTRKIPFDTEAPQEFTFKNGSIDIELSFVFSSQR